MASTPAVAQAEPSNRSDLATAVAGVLDQPGGKWLRAVTAKAASEHASDKADRTRAAYASDWASFHSWSTRWLAPITATMDDKSGWAVPADRSDLVEPVAAPALSLYLTTAAAGLHTISPTDPRLDAVDPDDLAYLWAEAASTDDDTRLAKIPGEVAELLARINLGTPDEPQPPKGLKVSTLERRLTSISMAHADAGLPSPTTHPDVRRQMKGLRRLHAKRARKVQPVGLNLAVQMANYCRDEDDPVCARDRALILVGFAGAFRRSELVQLDVSPEHLKFTEEGLTIWVPRTKTHPEGQDKFIPHGTTATACPVRALRVWLGHLGYDVVADPARELAAIADAPASTPLFRPITRGGAESYGNVRDRRLTAQSVALVVKRIAAEVGVTNPGEFSGHSLRAGFVTDARRAGAANHEIKKQTGHKLDTTVDEYDRSTPGQGNAVTRLGL